MLCILQVPSVTLYDARPVGLIYYSHEFHVMDLKVTNIHTEYKNLFYFVQANQCSCNDISFGSVNDIQTVSLHQDIPQPVNGEPNCPRPELKISETSTKESYKIKVIKMNNCINTYMNISMKDKHRQGVHWEVYFIIYPLSFI